jgi:hypothetical protein
VGGGGFGDDSVWVGRPFGYCAGRAGGSGGAGIFYCQAGHLLWMVLSAVSDTLTYISDSTINIYGTIVVTVHDARCDTS